MFKALRSLRNTPGFTATVLISLALGIGVNTAMFSAIQGLLLRPLPFPNPGRLVSVFEAQADRGPQPVSYDTMVDWQAQATSFEALAAYRSRTWGMTRPGQAGTVVIRAGMVTPDFFRVLGTTVVQGNENAVWLTHALWTARFGGDPQVIGTALNLNEEPHTITGILPPDFRFAIDGEIPDLYFPLQTHGRDGYGGSRAIRSLQMIGLLRPGVTLASARTELSGVALRLSTAFPATNRGYSAGVESLRDALIGDRRRPLVLLMTAVAVLLAIACVNVATLLLARAVARSREVALRITLGASRTHLFRHFLAEGLAIGLLGGGLGLWIADACLTGVQASPQLARVGGSIGAIQSLRLDGTALSFTLLLSVATALFFGLAPTLALSWTDLYGAMKRSGRRLLPALVIAEIALSVVLLSSSGLLLRAFWKVLSTRPGFEPEHLVVFGMGLPEARYDTEAKLLAYHEDLLARLSNLPGVTAAGAITGLPMTVGRGATFEREGRPLPIDRRPSAGIHITSSRYFETMRIPLIAGRGFTDRDRPGAPTVCLINQAMARTFWSAGEDPLGTRVRTAGKWREVAGIVGDTRQQDLEQAIPPQIYLPLAQSPTEGISYVLRSSVGPVALARSIREQAMQLDPTLEEPRPRAMEDMISRTLTDRRLALSLIGAFAGLALLLTAVGIHGLMAYSVTGRTRELGIRAALGERSGQTLKLILGDGLRLAAWGALIGFTASQWTARLLGSLLAGIPAADPITLAGACAMLAAIALAASFVPAWRATRVDPATCLKVD